MTTFWTYVFAGLYTLAGLAVGGFVAFERGVANSRLWIAEAIAAAIAWPITLLYFLVMLLRRLWQ